MPRDTFRVIPPTLSFIPEGRAGSKEFCEQLPPAIRRRSSVCCEWDNDCEVHGERCGYVKIVQADTHSQAESIARDYLGSSGNCGTLRRQMRKGTRTTHRLDRRTDRAEQRLDERETKFDFRQLKRQGRMANREDRQDTREDRQKDRAERREEGGGLGNLVADIGGTVGGLFGIAKGGKLGNLLGGGNVLPIAMGVLVVGGLAYAVTQGAGK